jgi:hypothetical protein
MIQDIDTFCISFLQFTLDPRGHNLLLKTVTNLSFQLRRLHLAPNSQFIKWMDLTPYWALDFPCLGFLELHRQMSRHTSKSMDFWRRHPSLQQLHLSYCHGAPLFSDDLGVVDSLLPKLKHLTVSTDRLPLVQRRTSHQSQANFIEVLRLVPLLQRLRRLSILDSHNAQVPYLLRSVMRDGLPNLRSLSIEHTSDLDLDEVVAEGLEGAYWYETLDGAFHEVPTGEIPSIPITDAGWVTSIAKGAPNLEELSLSTFDVQLGAVSAFRCLPYSVADLSKLKESLVRELSGFRILKRFLVRTGSPILSDLGHTSAANLEFVASVKSVAAECHALEEFCDGAAEPYRGYFTAKVLRHRDDVEVRLGMGRGLVIGQEDQAFPKAGAWDF